MLKFVAIVFGVALVTIEILIQVFNNGNCNTAAAWTAGVYIGLAMICLEHYEVLDCVLCLIPTVTILISNLIRKSNQRIHTQKGRPA